VHRRIICIVAALAAVVLAGTACNSGGSQLTHAQYQQQLDSIQKEAKTKLSSSLSDLQNITGVDQLPSIAGSLNKAADDIDGLADELDGLNPPDDAADANAKLADAIHGLADQFRQLADAAENSDVRKFQEIGQGFRNSDAIKEGDQAAAALRKAGYNVKGGIGQ